MFDSLSQHILLLCLSSSFYCFVHEEERGRRCSFKRNIFYFYFPACCLCQLCDRCIKKNLWTCCECKASNNALLSSKRLVIECYPAAPKYEEMIIIPPSVFNYGGGALSYIKVYRRPLALGGFPESSCILTHILIRGQVTLFDYYNHSHKFGMEALGSRFCLRTTSTENKNLLA